MGALVTSSMESELHRYTSKHDAFLWAKISLARQASVSTRNKQSQHRRERRQDPGDAPGCAWGERGS